jgi:hypothetical integral membrane protein (TIGR02206 family)
MKFFSYEPVPSSSPLYLDTGGAYHLMALGLIIVLGVVLVVFRKRIRDSGKETMIFSIGTVLALFFETVLHVDQYLTRPYYEFLRGLIPFELCAVTLWLSVALCITKNETVFELLYFWALGALASLLFANDDGAGPDRFRYYQYFGTHAYICLTVVYFIAVRGYAIRFKSLLKAVGILFPITLAMRLFDQAFSAPPYEFNFMFLLSPPDVSTPLDSFGQGWGYYFAFISLCAFLMVLAYLPWLFRKGGKRKGR